jgi:hypothetical protein
MVTKELDFGPSMARKFMAIAGDQRLLERSHENAPMPKHWTTLYELHLLDDTALDKALSNGKPHRADVQRLRAPNGSTAPSATQSDKITDADYTETRSPAAPSPVPSAGSAAPAEAGQSPPGASRQAAAQSLGAGGPEVDTREGGTPGVDSDESEEEAEMALRWFVSHVRAAAKRLDVLRRHGVTEYDVAKRWPSDVGMYADDLTKFTTCLIELDVAFRDRWGVGNEAAMREVEPT